ncbi:SRPBCC family protein [Amycolatopsis minnesotensis]|uniref:Activator of Hsp90 ATPase homologue 1/2-like C-terminal domain-containing protein n=1 Tax=Amycolatopsis minnesotensis TaxID=337894 RepID=A0ABP5BAF0_9PSEU
MSGGLLALRARIAAPVATVRHALTDVGSLRVWLAEHAGPAMTFWGRHTPDGAGPRQHLRRLDDRCVRFDWRLWHVDTSVHIGLSAASGGGTVLSLCQTEVPDWAEMAGEDTPLSVLGTFWSLALANLADHLEGRPLTPKTDFVSPELHVEIPLAATPGAVFASLVEPARFGTWFGTVLETDARIGGPWVVGTFELIGPGATIVALAPGRRLTVAENGFETGWELTPADYGTRLSLQHTGFDERNPPYAGWTGWLAGLAGLRRHHDGARPIWLRRVLPGVPATLITAGRAAAAER